MRVKLVPAVLLARGSRRKKDMERREDHGAEGMALG